MKRPKLVLYTVWTYKGARWRWRLVGANGAQVANCSEGDSFPTRSAALRNFRATRRIINDPNLVTVDE